MDSAPPNLQVGEWDQGSPHVSPRLEACEHTRHSREGPRGSASTPGRGRPCRDCTASLGGSDIRDSAWPALLSGPLCPGRASRSERWAASGAPARLWRLEAPPVLEQGGHLLPLRPRARPSLQARTLHPDRGSLCGAGTEPALCSREACSLCCRPSRPGSSGPAQALWGWGGSIRLCLLLSEREPRRCGLCPLHGEVSPWTARAGGAQHGPRAAAATAWCDEDWAGPGAPPPGAGSSLPTTVLLCHATNQLVLFVTHLAGISHLPPLSVGFNFHLPSEVA